MRAKSANSPAYNTVVSHIPARQNKCKVIVDSRLCPGAQSTWCTCWSLSLSKIWLESTHQFRLLHSPLRNTYDAPYAPLCGNMTSSTKPEVHSVWNDTRGGLSHGHKQHAQNLVKFGSIDLGICERTDRQTEINLLIIIVRTRRGGEVKEKHPVKQERPQRHAPIRVGRALDIGWQWRNFFVRSLYQLFSRLQDTVWPGQGRASEKCSPLWRRFLSKLILPTSLTLTLIVPISRHFLHRNYFPHLPVVTLASPHFTKCCLWRTVQCINKTIVDNRIRPPVHNS